MSARFIEGSDFVPAPLKPTVSFDVVDQVDVRVGTIRAVEEVPGSKKLMRLRVGFGDHERVILSGMRGEREDPQEIVGQQALFVVNLEPRKMAGELSEGMLFDLGSPDRLLPALAQPERPIPDGTRVG
ncbi:tRNA-binding protein [Streptacidiphilus sp. P02-A3a]|uniref:tRNA-binding protein n=1 Tax=Streptacidiphilus sp. P02-A3a TaxID=2704468 RepID=UPI0015F8ED80|nr:tRNA-binding protein [Streptacidiphilus sp. P02-A3a]QMU71314.1 tRNA-binding protein [Streptacidiphilus sp. P02-A3a]